MVAFNLNGNGNGTVPWSPFVEEHGAPLLLFLLLLHGVRLIVAVVDHGAPVPRLIDAV
jgi:hypothetical protein